MEQEISFYNFTKDFYGHLFSEFRGFRFWIFEVFYPKALCHAFSRFLFLFYIQVF